MKIEQHLPCAALTPYVKAFLIIDGDLGMSNRVLPGTSIVLAFRLSGAISVAGAVMPSSAVTGLRRSSRVIDYSLGGATLLATFREGGAAAFFRSPLHELFERTPPLDCLYPAARRDAIEERLAGEPDNARRVSLLEGFLLSALDPPPSDPLVDMAMHEIHAARGDLRISDLAARLCISQDPLEKRFRRIVGASPKQFSAIVRLRSVIARRPGLASLSEAAHSAGYYDQSHFIKDFKVFTGQTPRAFFNSRVPW